MPDTFGCANAIINRELEKLKQREDITLVDVRNAKYNYWHNSQDRFLEIVQQNLPKVLSICPTEDCYDIVIDSEFSNFQKFKTACEKAEDFLKEKGFKVEYVNQKYSNRLRISGW